MPAKQQITILLDPEVVNWFKSLTRGRRGYQTEINQALRDYIYSQESGVLEHDKVKAKESPEFVNWMDVRQRSFLQSAKQQITIRLDEDIVDWFKSLVKGGRGYQTEINNVLNYHIYLQEFGVLGHDKTDANESLEFVNWMEARQGSFHQPAKQQITILLDEDIVDWFESLVKGGRGYQSEINQVLRKHIYRSNLHIPKINQEVVYQPWEGEHYGEFNGLKLLVLGESHYIIYDSEGKPIDPEDPYLTKNVVEEWALSTQKKYAFFTIVANVLLKRENGGARDAKNAAIWRRVAFYNYVSSSVSWRYDSPSPDRPTDLQWINSQGAFEKVLEQLKPNAVLMLGSELSYWVTKNHNHTNFEDLYLPYSHQNVHFLGIKHPRSGLVYKEAIDAFDQLIELANSLNLTKKTKNRKGMSDLKRMDDDFIKLPNWRKGMIKLNDIWNIHNPEEFKLHFARNDGNDEPLDVFAEDREKWQGWQEHYPGRNDYNRDFIFSLMQYYHEPNEWLFGGIYRVLDLDIVEEAYEVELVESGSEFIGRLILKSDYKAMAPRVEFEKHYNSFIVSEILREPYLG